MKDFFRCSLRKADSTDINTIFEWINESEVRAMSTKPQNIPWEEHERWFLGRLKDNDFLYLIAEDQNGVPKGQVRFSITENSAEVSVLVDKEERGRGLGEWIISKGTQILFENTHATEVHAFVRRENVKSYRAFLRAGYHSKGETLKEGVRLEHLVCVKKS